MYSSDLGLVWNPQWHHAHESLWSVLGKIGIANKLSAAELQQELEVFNGWGGGLWLPDSPLRAHNLFSGIELSPLRTRTAFLWDLAPDSGRAPLVHRAVRYCPKCLANAFHSVLFQFRPLTRCPRHGDYLQDVCPRCLRPIDPLNGAPWSCGWCGYEYFCFAGREWIERFKASDTGEVFETARAALISKPDQIRQYLDRAFLEDPCKYAEFSCAESGEGRFAVVGPPFDKKLSFLDSHYQGIRLAYWYFDEHLGLIKRLLFQHIACLREEPWGAGSPVGVPIPFKCPVAAALIQSAKYAGIPPYSDVSVRPPQKAGAAVMELMEPLLFDAKKTAYLSETAAEGLARAAARTMLADALRTFCEAAGSGCATWNPSRSEYQVKWTFNPELSMLDVLTNATAQVIRELERQARCPLKT